MLEADRQALSILDEDIGEIAADSLGEAQDSIAKERFGPYRLTKLLGEGGMGVVWLAERDDLDNLVAVKFLPHAGLSPSRRERFAREIRTLAKLRHSYIARLYDAGALADGTPWFAMEYVEGIRFGEYCREPGHSISERLQLFRRVCEAVQYAHSQEIIHRDLKPSNIIVTPEGDPRLLDFGISSRRCDQYSHCQNQVR
jgi:serine/threonine protein kinase